MEGLGDVQTFRLDSLRVIAVRKTNYESVNENNEKHTFYSFLLIAGYTDYGSENQVYSLLVR
ncbi:hypothetical protein [Algoriphagus sp. AGSA1]|uniref:hypothetical protein n=1 Tax=Algoriphagus sp. AGSA1 TaxID=2907213 RepID=UPI001F195FBF|nr:hypothetical protein [Algoriphagus sp. AGSA1]